MLTPPMSGSNFLYFSRSVLKYSSTGISLSRPIPVSRSPPARAATSDSVGGWLVPMEKGEIAVSTMSAPALSPA